jgi:Na+-translocating ferredoxin:NAD+ oxidoreductase RnfG subunit
VKYYPLGATTAIDVPAANIEVTTNGGTDDYVTAITVTGQCVVTCIVGAYKFEIEGLKNP